MIVKLKESTETSTTHSSLALHPNMSSLHSPQIWKKKGNRVDTPTVTRKESYEDYNLSPPKVPRKKAFDDAVRAINRDFPKLRVAWESNGEKVKWTMIGNGEQVELQFRTCRVLLFLYSRNFMMTANQVRRKEAVKEILGNKADRIHQVMDVDGDIDLSNQEAYQIHYIRACTSIHRFFQQIGTTGFSRDMSNVTYYFRMQKHGGCFLQAPCVAMSYILGVCGQPTPPSNVSRLVRHHFTDKELMDFVVRDSGDDSSRIFEILEKKFFVSNSRRMQSLITASYLSEPMELNRLTTELAKQPLLVSRFAFPDNFWCKPPSQDVRSKCPDLDYFLRNMEEPVLPKHIWSKIPADLIPPGVARFSTWGEPAQFILLDDPVNSSSQEEEDALVEGWRALLNAAAVGNQDDNDTQTTLVESMPSSSSDEMESSHSESSSSYNASMLTTHDYFEEDLSFLDHDEQDDDSASTFWEVDERSVSTSSETDEFGEGDTTSSHAMILLGYREVDGSKYWLLQNSWEGPMQIIEVSTEYLMSSSAGLLFYNLSHRRVKTPAEWTRQNLTGFFCSSPVAESSHLERSDGEWSDGIYPTTGYESC